MARPRRALHRAFARFLAENHSRFAIEVRFKERKDAVLSFAFVGIDCMISGWINTFEITVAVTCEDEIFDLILDRGASPIQINGGYICRFRKPSVLYLSRKALWAHLLFEPFLSWVNNTLTPSPWLELMGTASPYYSSARAGCGGERSLTR